MSQDRGHAEYWKDAGQYILDRIGPVRNEQEDTLKLLSVVLRQQEMVTIGLMGEWGSPVAKIDCVVSSRWEEPVHRLSIVFRALLRRQLV